jgi:hypothetical protein
LPRHVRLALLAWRWASLYQLAAALSTALEQGTIIRPLDLQAVYADIAH